MAREMNRLRRRLGNGWRRFADAGLRATNLARQAARRPSGPEPLDIPSKRVVLVLGGWIVFAAVSVAAVVAYILSVVPLASPEQAVSPLPEPRLQTDPQGDLKRLVREQRSRFAGYAWVDREAGLVHVPIEEAMRLVLSRGEAGYGPVATSADGRSPADTAEARRRAVEATLSGSGREPAP